MPWNDEEAREHVGRLETELASLTDRSGDVPAEHAVDVLAALIALYGEALERIMGHAAGSPAVSAAITGDELVGHLLLVHELHPLDARSRVEAALEQVRAAGGTGVELAAIYGTAVRVRCRDEPSSRALRAAVQRAIGWLAPEIDEVAFEPGMSERRASGAR